jgi:hypothetical protein
MLGLHSVLKIKNITIKDNVRGILALFIPCILLKIIKKSTNAKLAHKNIFL